MKRYKKSIRFHPFFASSCGNPWCTFWRLTLLVANPTALALSPEVGNLVGMGKTWKNATEKTGFSNTENHTWQDMAKCKNFRRMTYGKTCFDILLTTIDYIQSRANTTQTRHAIHFVFVKHCNHCICIYLYIIVLICRIVQKLKIRQQ